METIKCPKCGALDKFYTELKANNNVARCSECDTFIKNIPYQTEQVLYIGKYKGKRVSEVQDLSWLKWAEGNIKNLKPVQRTAILKQISNLENLGR